MLRRPRAIGRSLGRGLGRRLGLVRAGAPAVQGIRFRLGMAMALALLPIFILSLVQTQDAFDRQSAARRADLQTAAVRSAAAAKARFDSAQVLLRTLSPESLGPWCEPRLTALVNQLEGYSALYRFTATGQPACVSRTQGAAPVALTGVGQPWFQRFREGADVVVARAPPGVSREPAVIVAIRVERPLGAFDGVTAALIPLSTLQPDLTDPGLPPGSQAALTDEAGRMLIASDPTVFDLRGPVKLEGWVQRAREGDSGVFEAVDASGDRRAYAGAALASRDVFALVSAPAPSLLSWAQLNPIGNLLLPLAAWLTAFAAVMLFSERIVVRWLDYLERVAAIYARGRFSVRPVQAVNAPSEIRVLARTLDELAEAITVRDASLTASLAEKDALMREIHHRVKNNLQIISSLLSMQQRALTDGAAKAALGDTRQRISALALIYRTLYQSENLRYADARDFLTELVGQLVASEAGRGPVVISRVVSDSLIVDPDKLAPLALWLVEAVTNAQKHAFAGRGGTLEVRFRVDGDVSVLEVEDDGPGAPDSQVRAGVGGALMGAFAKQLRGSVEIVPGAQGGTIARMTFATPEALTPTDPADAASGTAPAPSR